MAHLKWENSSFIYLAPDYQAQTGFMIHLGVPIKSKFIYISLLFAPILGIILFWGMPFPI